MGKSSQTNRKAGRLAGLVLALALFAMGAIFPGAVQAKEVVRVAYVPVEGYMMMADDGMPQGMLYDYLEMLSGYMGVDFVYIPGPPEQCLWNVEHGIADVVANVVNGPLLKKHEGLIFSEQPVAKAMVDLCFESTSQNPWTIGYYDKMIDADALDTAIRRVWSLERPVYALQGYPTVEALRAAWQAHEVSAQLGTESLGSGKNDDVMRLELFVADTYFVTTHDHAAIMQRLDAAAYRLHVDNPTFRESLYAAYRTGRRSIALTPAEKKYLAERGGITMLATGGQPPYTYFEHGVHKGVIADVAAEMSQEAGIPFTVVDSGSNTAVLENFADGKADVILDFNTNSSWAASHDARVTFPYMTIDYVAVVSRSRSMPETPIVACAKGHFYVQQFIEKMYKKEQLRYYDTDEECLRAVSHGEANITFAKSVAVQYAIHEGGFYDLYTNGVVAFSHQVSMAVRRDADPMLLRILNKIATQMDRAKVQGIVNRYMYDSGSPKDLRAYIYRNPMQAALVILGVSALILMGLLHYIRVRRKNGERVWNLAYVNQETGLYNLRWFREQLPDCLRRYEKERNEGRLAILSIALQHTALLRETYAPDLLIASLLRRTVQVRREYSWLRAHAVNSELSRLVVFCVLPEDLSAEQAARKILDVTRVLDIGGVATQIQLCIGISPVPREGENSLTTTQLIDNALIAQNDAEAEENEIGIYNEALHAKISQRKQIELLMHKALEQQEFKVYLQPKYDIRTQELVGAESLVRWISPELGFVNPGAFIELFERNGFIARLDDYMLESVMATMRKRIDEGLPIVPVSVNQSGIHIHEDGYLDRMQKFADHYGLPKGAIELEITETAFIDFSTKESRANASHIIDALREMGYGLSMDDFCTGYSSIAMLENLPMDVMKIDRSMLLAAEKSERAKNIIAHVVSMGRSLGMRVLTEGVETREQEDLLLSVGCHYGQGFLFGKPMPSKDFAQFALEHKVRNMA